MAPRQTKPAKLDPAAHDRLKQLKTGMGKRRLPRKVDGVDILSALVLYTPEPQLVGMLQEYWWDTDAQAGSTAED